jgi:sirohydrochlorin cobaltochelatase
MSLAIVLFAHGSRDPHWHEPIAAVAQAIAERSPHTVVRCAYLELSTPSLPQAVETLVAQGTDAVRVFPLFLGMGKHAREDLPQLMHSLRQTHPQVRFELLQAAGQWPALTALLADLALQEQT